MKVAPFKLLIWKRYIDGVFTIFTCSEDELNEFLTWINGVHPTIKFTLTTHKDGIPFLDTHVHIEDGEIIVRPYTKETDRKHYLLPSSCHPRHCIDSIPYSQALRVHRICTKEADFEAEMKNMTGYFKNREYDPFKVEDAIERVRKPRNKIHPTEASSKETPVIMVIPFHPSNPPFQNAINELWPRYEKNLNNEMSKPIIAFTRPQNLKDILVKARYGPPAIPNEITERNLTNRPLSTYDKEQLGAPIKHVVFRCPNHQELQESYSSLQEAISSDEYRNFKMSHSQCGDTNVIPVTAKHLINIKCNECRFQSKIISTKRASRITRELLNVAFCIKNSILRQEQSHTSCDMKCNVCEHKWNTATVTDHRGTNYRLLKFDCCMKNVIYIIHCQQCKINYVGLTKNMLKSRIHNHLYNIRSEKNTSVAEHFTGHNLNDLKIGILDTSQNNEDLKIREGIWINILNTVANGINRREELYSKMDYQTLAYGKHFLHSRTCIPYFTTTLLSTLNLDLRAYRKEKYGHRFLKQSRTAAKPTDSRKACNGNRTLTQYGFTRRTTSDQNN